MTLNTKTMNELWRRMADLYGHRWVSQYGEADENGTWRRVLASLTPAQIAVGLRQCVAIGRSRAQTGDEDWPPTAGEFAGFCVSTRAPCHQLYQALPFDKTVLTEAQKNAIVNDLCAAAGMPLKYPAREHGCDKDAQTGTMTAKHQEAA